MIYCRCENLEAVLRRGIDVFITVRAAPAIAQGSRVDLRICCRRQPYCLTLQLLSNLGLGSVMFRVGVIGP
jgi:hypothetical protein